MEFTDRHDDLMRAAFARARQLEPTEVEIAAVLDRARTAAARREHTIRFTGWRVLATGAACLAFGGTAAAATGVWDPQIGTEATDSPPPSISNAPISAAVTDSLAVLRREPTDQDHGPEVEATLRTLGEWFGFVHSSDPTPMGELLSQFKYGVKGVRPDSVRYLAPGADGKATILFSAEDAGFALFGALGAPESGGQPVYLDGQGVCMFKPTGGGTPFGSLGEGFPLCFVLNAILDGKATWSTVGGIEPSGGAYGIVPDGVASVTAKFPNGTEVDAPVANNYFQLTWGAGESAPVEGSEKERAANADWEEPTEFVWYDAEGAIVQPQQPGHEG